MPDKRRHRGAHPDDQEAFAPDAIDVLRTAAGDYCWLLTRGYAEKSALKLVGDRFGLGVRQRMAVMRCSCSEQAMIARRARQVDRQAVIGRELWIDGYNLLTTVESALAGGVILIGRDGCYRDLASMHGTFRKVAETGPAIELVAQAIDTLELAACRWYLDRPVSNSGRLKGMIETAAEKRRSSWQVELVYSPDKLLSESTHIIVSADSAILDRPVRWFNLAGHIVEQYIGLCRRVDLAV